MFVSERGRGRQAEAWIDESARECCCVCEKMKGEEAKPGVEPYKGGSRGEKQSEMNETNRMKFARITKGCTEMLTMAAGRR